MRLRTLMTLAIGAVLGAVLAGRALPPEHRDLQQVGAKLSEGFRQHAPRGVAVVVEQVTRFALGVVSFVVRQAVESARRS